MSEKSNISWTDSTINFWSGCTKVSPGCAHCYAETRDKRHMIEPVSHWGPKAKRLKHKGAVKDALAFNNKPWICDACGEASASSKDGNEPFCTKCNSPEPSFHRRRIFSLSLGDWLDDEVPIEWLAEMLDTIRQCDQVTWILCTKRPENFEPRFVSVMQWLDNKTPDKKDDALWNWILDWESGEKIPTNIILLTSVENQEQADKRIPELLRIPAACRGLSLEPLLGPVDLSEWYWQEYRKAAQPCGISWKIIGGESGPQARPCNVDWIRSMVAQGNAAGVATFVKQLGAHRVFNEPKDAFSTLNVRDKKGGDPAEWPKDLQIQQWPKGF